MFSCVLCNKKFIRNYAFDKHVACCTWLHANKAEPSPKLSEIQRDTLLSDIFLQMQHLDMQHLIQIQKKVAQQQKLILRLQKKTNSYLISLDTQKPCETFPDWFRAIPITLLHLQAIFTHDLLESIFICITDAIQQYKRLLKIIPFCAFTNTQKNMYAFHEAWGVLSKEQLQLALQIMSRRFECLYAEWQQQNASLINSSEEWKVKDMNFCRTVMDVQSESSRMARFRSGLYELVHSPA